MHEVVLPGQGTLHRCPICGVQFEGHYGRLAKRRWKAAQEEGTHAVTALLQGDDAIAHQPPNCLGRYLPGQVLANEPDRRRAEALAQDVIQTYFDGTGTEGSR